MRFSFRLEPLLTSRRRVEQDAQRALAELLRQRHVLEADLRRRQHEITTGKNHLRESLTGRLDLRALRLGTGSTLHVIRKAQQLVLQLAGLEERMETARQQLLAATTSRRAIELLRERRFEAWKAEIDKAETAVLDELAVARAGARARDATEEDHA